MSVVSKIVGAAMLLAVSGSSQAGLILNGDFENNPLNAGSWRWFNSSQVDGWQGSNIEVWHALNGVLAPSGNHFIELNAHGSNSGSWSISQTFATEVGHEYLLSFFYRARANNNEKFNVSVADVNWLLDDHTTSDWLWFNQRFVANSDSTSLQFTALNAGTVGNFLDGVQVSSLPSLQVVPAPASLAMFGLGIAALMAFRRKKAA